MQNYAFSGGQTDVTDHRRLGGRTNIDVPYQYLSYFLEDDDTLQKIHDSYESGEMLTGEIKEISVTELWKFMQTFQERRQKITDEELSIFMDGTRPLRLAARYNWSGRVISNLVLN